MEGIKINNRYHPDDNNIVIVDLGGYVDQTNCHQVEKVISDILKSSKLKIIFDFTELIYMSSAGWGIFVGEIKMVRDLGGDIKISSMSPEVYEVFQMLEFFHIIQDFNTLDEAVSSFSNVGFAQAKPAKVQQRKAGEDASIDQLLEESGVETQVSVNDEEDDEIIIEDIEESVTVDKATGFEAAPASSGTVAASAQEFRPMQNTPERIDISRLPLSEKIKRVVANYPLLNLFQIRKMLSHEKFGNTRVGLLKLYRTLKFLSLESKAKRYRFYRSS